MWQRIGSADIPSGHLSIANQALAGNISAALTLGDMNYLCTDIKWVEGLLDNYNIPTESLHQYVNAYYDAAKAHLGDAGRPILDWLAELSGRKLKEA